MNVYLVGGAVRDRLMGLKPKDNDYVVVGATVEQMLELGFVLVGKDFPVFINPSTGDEYALARTERKISPGYTGFETVTEGVTLIDDLKRRDLTINAIAMCVKTNEIIDPFNGVADIEAKLLRPVSEAFKEDPVRVLRVGRFLSKYPDFRDAEGLVEASEEAAKELKHCHPARIGAELLKAMATNMPSRFLDWCMQFKIFPILNEMSSTPQNAKHHPEIWTDIHTLLTVDMAAKLTECSPLVTFAALCHDFGKPECYRLHGNLHGHDEMGVKPILEFCKTYHIPNVYRDLAVKVAKLHIKIHSCLGNANNAMMTPKKIVALLTDMGLYRNPADVSLVLAACEADYRGRGADPEQRREFETKRYPQADFLKLMAHRLLQLNTKHITTKAVASGMGGKSIGGLIQEAKINAVKLAIEEWKAAESHIAY